MHVHGYHNWGPLFISTDTEKVTLGQSFGAHDMLPLPGLKPKTINVTGKCFMPQYLFT